MTQDTISIVEALNRLEWPGALVLTTALVVAGVLIYRMWPR